MRTNIYNDLLDLINRNILVGSPVNYYAIYCTEPNIVLKNLFFGFDAVRINIYYQAT